MKKIFFRLAVVMMAVSLASCDKLQLATEVKTSNDGLFLKSAAIGEIAGISYLKDGKIDQFSYPNNLLFEIKKEGAKVLNSMLEVKGFDLLSEKEAMFLVAKWDSKPIVLGTTADGKVLYDLNAQNVYASKLPFVATDYGLQTNEANGRFNGLLKAENYVLAINSGTDNSAKILIYDLRTGAKVSVAGSIQNDVLTFKVGTETWVLKFISLSPIGNIFEFSGGGKTSTCYTLS